MTDTKNKSKGNSRASSPERKRGASGNHSDNSRTQSRQDGQKREFFKEELKRLQDGLNREASKIHKPAKKSFTPYLFNSLRPYYDDKIVAGVVQKPDEIPRGYTNRPTAVGLCDPWVAHMMDQNTTKRDQGVTSPQQELGDKKESKKKKAGSKKTKEGSTRLPKFPAVSVPKGALAAKTLTYSDVPMLRKELRQKYSNNAQIKIEKDYTRTKQDFYRMDLDLMDEYHPINRDHMKATYFAYLQNNPGSSKAVKECVHDVTESLGEQKSPQSRPNSGYSHRSRPSSSHSKLSVKA